LAESSIFYYLFARSDVASPRRALLADGSESIFDIYEAVVIWDSEARRIPVDQAETTPLVGMSLLEGYELTVQAQAGGNVTIAALSQSKHD
jgi:predicted aspartyl protease